MKDSSNSLSATPNSIILAAIALSFSEETGMIVLMKFKG
jgi:hypothetical protein